MTGNRVKWASLLAGLAFVIFYLGFAVSPVRAEDNFSATYDQTYKLNADGSTNVTQTITVTNLSSQVLTDKSTLFLPFKDVTDITASDPSGPLKMNVTKQTDGTELFVVFNNPAAGIGQKYFWTLSFTTFDLIKKYGYTTEIILPRLQLPEPITDYSVRLLLNNADLGKMIYVWPAVTSKLEWSRADLKDKNVHLIFSSAPSQSYNLSLQYLLKNKKLYPATLEIPLFSNTPTQSVVISSLTPRPLDVIADKNGTWMAKYYLGPNSQLKINSEIALATKLDGTVSASNQTAVIFPDKSRRMGTHEELAKKLGSPEQIYRYVVNTFRPEATCREESALFVEMVSDLGIPARLVSGLLYPDNRHLHCWTEFYDEGTGRWHEVDPQLEINNGSDYFRQWDPYHLALVSTDLDNSSAGIPLSQIYFKASLDPLPVGPLGLGIQADLPTESFSGFNFGGKVTVSNEMGLEYPNLVIIPVAQFLKPKLDKIVVGNLPPYGRRVISVDFNPGANWSFSGNDIISLTVNGEAYSYQVRLTPFYTSPIVIVTGGLIFVFIIFTLAKISGSLLFQRRRGADSLHR